MRAKISSAGAGQHGPCNGGLFTPARVYSRLKPGESGSASRLAPAGTLRIRIVTLKSGGKPLECLKTEENQSITSISVTF